MLESPEEGRGAEPWAWPHLRLELPLGPCILSQWRPAATGLGPVLGGLGCRIQGPVFARLWSSWLLRNRAHVSSPSLVCVSSDSFSVVSKLSRRKKGCCVLVPYNPGVLSTWHGDCRSRGSGARGVNLESRV